MKTDTRPITWTTEQREGTCSDVIQYLAAAQLKQTTVSYQLIFQDQQGIKHSHSFQFEKLSVAANNISQFMNDPTSVIEPIIQNKSER